MTTGTRTDFTPADDEVVTAEALAVEARRAAGDDGTVAAQQAIGNHNTVDTSTAPTIDVIRAGIRSLLIAWDGVEAVHGHGYYEAQIDTDIAFGSPDDFYKGKATFTVFDGLTTGVTYYARVRAVDAAGNTGPWSSSTGAQTSDPTKTGDIDDEAVTTVKIDDLAVTTAKIGNLQVTEAKIGSLAVTTAKIDDLAVTNAKIGSLAVTEAKIANLAVTEAKIGNLAVDTAKIKNLAVETLKIADLNVTIDKESSPVLVESLRNSGSGSSVPTSTTTATTNTHTVPSWAGVANVSASVHSDISNTTGTDGLYAVSAAVGGVGFSFFMETGYNNSIAHMDSQVASNTYAREISGPGSTVAATGHHFRAGDDLSFFMSLRSTAIFTR